mmetsp:Transcript_73126/g.174386  ORF Transcript_73126/g.174386 Transcript_73126/m.174386 type:complete len:202 (-) Transcript_73126:114-719(-)
MVPSIRVCRLGRYHQQGWIAANPLPDDDQGVPAGGSRGRGAQEQGEVGAGHRVLQLHLERVAGRWRRGSRNSGLAHREGDTSFAGGGGAVEAIRRASHHQHGLGAPRRRLRGHRGAGVAVHAEWAAARRLQRGGLRLGGRRQGVWCRDQWTGAGHCGPAADLHSEHVQGRALHCPWHFAYLPHGKPDPDKPLLRGFSQGHH